MLDKTEIKGNGWFCCSLFFAYVRSPRMEPYFNMPTIIRVGLAVMLGPVSAPSYESRLPLLLLTCFLGMFLPYGSVSLSRPKSSACSEQHGTVCGILDSRKVQFQAASSCLVCPGDQPSSISFLACLLQFRILDT